MSRAEGDGSGDQVERLLELVLDHPDARQAGELDRVCAAHPELARALRSRFRTFRQLDRRGVGSATEPGPFGDYDLVRPLGSGGMGVVWLARQSRGELQRDVALKLIHHSVLHTEVAHLRFRREASAVMRLDHPGICQVYDVGEVDGTPYLALRLVAGKTLLAHLDDARDAERPLVLPGAQAAGSTTPPAAGRSRVADILGFVEQAARAVHAAHEAGVIHRDIKPGNLMVTPSGDPVLLDFGLARDLADADTLTRTGQALGTPLYMAPEQIAPTAGRAVGRPTDVYALGALLYECLTLRPPFQGQTQEEILLRVLNDPPPRVRRFDPSLHPQLDVVVETALRKQPERRYPTALAFAEDLRRLREQRPIVARRTGLWLRTWLWSQRNPAVAGALVVLTVALGVTLWMVAEARASRLGYERSFLRAQAAIAEVVAVARDHLRDMPGSMTERQQMLTRALAFYQELLAEPPSDQHTRQAWALARVEAGKLRKELGDYGGARADLVAALRELEPRVGTGSQDRELLRGVATALRTLAGVEFDAGQFAQASTLAERTIVALRRVLEQDGTEPGQWLQLCELSLFRATVAFHAEQWDELETLVAAALDELAAHGEDHGLDAEVLALRAQAYSRRSAAQCRRGRARAGHEALVLALADYRAALAADPRSRTLRGRLAEALQQHAGLSLGLDQLEPARASAGEALLRYEELERDFPGIEDYRDAARQARSLVRSLEQPGPSPPAAPGSSGPAHDAPTASTRERIKELLAQADAAGRSDDTDALRRALAEAVALFDAKTARSWRDVERAFGVVVRLLPLLDDGREVVERATDWTTDCAHLGAPPERVGHRIAELWMLRCMQALARGDGAAAESAADRALPLVEPVRRADAQVLHAEAVVQASPARGIDAAAALAATPPPDPVAATRLLASSQRLLGMARARSGDADGALAAWNQALANLAAAGTALAADPALCAERVLVAAELATSHQGAERSDQARELAREAVAGLLPLLAEPPRGPAQRYVVQARRLLHDLPDAVLGHEAAELRRRLAHD